VLGGSGFEEIGHTDVKHTGFAGHDVNMVDHRRDCGMVAGIVSGQVRCVERKKGAMGRETKEEERFLDCAGRRFRRSENGRKNRPAPLGMTPLGTVP
jgi:hypothetical protein